MEELIISRLKTQELTPRNQVVLGCTLKYTTSAVQSQGGSCTGLSQRYRLSKA